MLSIHDPNLKQKIPYHSIEDIHEKMQSMYRKSKAHKYMSVFLGSFLSFEIALACTPDQDPFSAITIGACTSLLISRVLDETNRYFHMEIIKKRDKK